MTKRKNPEVGRPRVVQTVELLRARCNEVGECLEWTGYMTNNVPQVTHMGHMVPVRRLMLELSGRPVRDGAFVGCDCGNKSCVNPEHAVIRTPTQHLQKMANIGAYNEAARLAKLMMHARKRSKLTVDAVRDIRLSSDSSNEVAKQYGVSRQTISRIRSGDAWKETSSPFAGLGAR